MHDELLYEHATVHAIRMRLENGSADVITVPEGDDVRILIDTDAEDAAPFLSVDVKDGTLLIRQRTPIPQLLKSRKRPTLHVTVEAPQAWKGALHAKTASGRLHAEGVSGTDVTLGTVSGMLEAQGINGICVSLSGVTGEMAAEDIVCEKLRVASLSSAVRMQNVSFDRCRVQSASGDALIGTSGGMESIRCSTVSGDLTVATAHPAVDAAMHAASGCIRTQGVDLADGQPAIRMATLTGRLTIIRTEGE